ncbi:MAG: SGNH/GDSL hydrolase family protein [Planctomycetes bacterium]|nr:SGNH/GDSL hydrolase family protein [Planctomycetota bacterium]
MKSTTRSPASRTLDVRRVTDVADVGRSRRRGRVALAIVVVWLAFDLAISGEALYRSFDALGMARTVFAVLGALAVIGAAWRLVVVDPATRRSAFDVALFGSTSAFAIAVGAMQFLRALRDVQGVAWEILIRAASLGAASIAIAVAASSLFHSAPFVVRTSRVALRLGFSALLALGAFAILEAWASTRGITSWYAVESLDGSGATLHEQDADLIWRMRSNFRGRFIHPEMGGGLVETNSIGLRDAEIDPSEPSPAFVLGDSFAFGLGVEGRETLAARLETIGAVTRALNAGCSGFCTLDELVMLERLSKRMRPSLVIVLVYPANDLEENLVFLKAKHYEGRTDFLASLFPTATLLATRACAGLPKTDVLATHLVPHSWLRSQLEKRSAFARIVFDGVDRMAVKRGTNPKEPPVNQMLLRSIRMGDAADEELKLAFRVTADALRAIQVRASNLGARCLVCLAPARVQVETDLFREVMKLGRLDADRFDVDRPMQVLSKLGSKLGFECFDLTPTFRAAAARGERLYFQEGHWNAAGHALAARAIRDRLAEPTSPR